MLTEQDNMRQTLVLPPAFQDVSSRQSPSQSSFKKPLDSKVKRHPVTRSCVAEQNIPKNIDKGNHVTFGKRVKVKKIRSHKMFSQAEYDAIWHNEEEYATIKKGCIATLRLMMNQEFQENEDYCPRGLEVRTKEGSSTRKEVRLRASMAVLEEQEMQAAWGTKDMERIRGCYLDISADAKSRAHFRGLADAKIAREC